jgi:Tfp pilus assembly protein PilN
LKPVNLIPPEQRRGERAPSRTGPAAYVVVAMLAVALGAVTLTVLTNNKVTDRQSEVATLEAEETAATAEANRLSSYAEFASLQLTREQTVSTLARSRFDWERVLRELAIVIPGDVWLTDVTAKVSPSVTLTGSDAGAGGSSSSQSDLASGVAGPSLQLTGCGASHEAVAQFAAALEDIDGVTRVGVGSSELPDDTQTGTGTAGTGDCRTREFISQFQITVAFDGVQVDAASGMPVPPPAAAPATDDGGVAGAQAQEQQARDSTQSQTDRAGDAVTLIPGTVR